MKMIKDMSREFLM